MPYKDPALAKAASRRSYHRRKGSEAYKEKLRRSADTRRERYKNDAAYKALVDARNATRRDDPNRRRKAVAVAAKWKKNNPGRYEELNRKYLLAEFGITPEQYMAMHDAQGGKCAICWQPETTPNRRRTGVRMLAVDHCHTSGVVRALLCSACNTSLGKFREDPALLRAAAVYLEKYRTPVVGKQGGA